MYSVYSVQKRKVSSKCFYIVPILNITCDIVYSLFFNLCYFSEHATDQKTFIWSGSVSVALAVSLHLDPQVLQSILLLQGSIQILLPVCVFHLKGVWHYWHSDTEVDLGDSSRRRTTLDKIQSLLRSKCYAFVGLQKA